MYEARAATRAAPTPSGNSHVGAALVAARHKRSYVDEICLLDFRLWGLTLSVSTVAGEDARDPSTSAPYR